MIILSLAAVFPATSVWGVATSLNGAAEVGYTQYDASANGSNLFRGNSLVQQYSLEYRVSNYAYRYQPNYYKLMVGYDLVDFSTRLSEPAQETTIKQSLGKFRYTGEVSYTQSVLPISITGYIKDNLAVKPKKGLVSNSLIDNSASYTGGAPNADASMENGLAYDLEGRQKNISSGFTVNFDPKKAGSASLRTLPFAIFEYRDSSVKGTGFYPVDSMTRQLDAALGQENNWINYRLIDSRDFLSPSNDLIHEQIQIGLVDYRGKRKWSALTNWITVSADARLIKEKNISTASHSEEYDVNFMAIASRRAWDARTFMNYNRELDIYNVLTEKTSVPLYVKGIYGSETEWFASLMAFRGKQSHFPASNTDLSYTNMLTVGATTFTRSKFTLAPSISLQTSKSFNGNDSYALSSVLETVSTKRFSDKLGLGAKLSSNIKDDGTTSSNSKSLSESLILSATYVPYSSLVYKVQNTSDFGSGYGYIDGFTPPSAYINVKFGNYYRNIILAAAGWTPNAHFNASIEGTYGFISVANIPEYSEKSVSFRARYDRNVVIYSVDTRYVNKNNSVDQPLTNWRSSAQVQYRPNIYNDGFLRATYEQETGGATNADDTKVEFIQRYSYNFFSRKGVSRNVATLSEEYSFTKQPSGGGSSIIVNSPIVGDVQYLLLSGRYSPSDRYSLYGSAKYEKTNPSGAVTMYYSAGMTTDFRLLSTSIDYTLAKRDIDNRVEKKLAASVRRSF
jgi:hypothetical protein